MVQLLNCIPHLYYYSDPQKFVVSGQNLRPTKLRSILKPLLLRDVLIPKLNTIDVSRQ
jgi:hypothetical protein